MEQQLPKNWVNPFFTDVFDINGGTQPPKSQFIDEIKEGYIRLLQIRDFGAKPVPTFIPDTGKLRTCNYDDILIARYGASIGRIVTGQKGAYNVALAKVNIPEVINKKYVLWVLKSHIFQNVITSFQRTAQSGFNKDDLGTINIPLPPLPEQNRIVAKLDVLFGQLDKINTSLDKIPTLLKNFKQAVLTQAVTGKLTEEWRVGKELESNTLEDNGKYSLGFNFETPKKWSIYPIGNVLSFQQGMQIAKETRLNSPGKGILPILRIKNYHDGFIKDVEYIKIDEKSLIAEKDDIILTRTGESRGWVLTGFQGVFHNNTFRINFPKEKVLGKYLKYFLNQSQIQSFIKYNSGRTGQPDLTHKSFGPCPFVVPSIEEQTEIVKRVESLFTKADFIEIRYKALKAQVTKLPQAILAKAFKGELVPQLETDGNAADLLQEILALKEELKSKPKKKVVRKKK